MSCVHKVPTLSYRQHRTLFTIYTCIVFRVIHSAAIVAIRKFNFQTGKTFNVNLELEIVSRARHTKTHSYTHIFIARLIETGTLVVYCVASTNSNLFNLSCLCVYKSDFSLSKHQRLIKCTAEITIQERKPEKFIC